MEKENKLEKVSKWTLCQSLQKECGPADAFVLAQ